jgi:membrane AbrB-like protein
MTEQDRRDGHAKSVDQIDAAPKAAAGSSAAAAVDMDAIPAPAPVPTFATQRPRERITLLGSIMALALGAAGSMVFVYCHLPLPWFLGALSFCLVASVLQWPITRPAPLSIPMRCVLGVAVGSAFTPALFGRMGSMVVSLLLLIPFMALIVGVGIPFYERLAGFNRQTAFFSAVPGGLVDMASMAEDSGANSRTVVLVQATRILIIVFILPFSLQILSGIHIGPVAANAMHLVDLKLVDGAVLFAMGLFGWLGARTLRMAGAPIVGPMILSGLIHACGFTAVKMPAEILIIAQITVGTLLGAQFRGLTWKEFSSTVIWGVAFTVLLLLLTAVVVFGVVELTGFNAVSVLLAYAPGGQTEINLLAFVLGLDVAYIALHHLARLAIVILGAQMVFATTRGFGHSRRLAPRSRAKEPERS